jgi:uncharacterized protein YyaL (SSP411 family)
MNKEPKFTNRLIHETSPYLLQHAHNPVDWFPWGEEALSRARQEDKPILLSIGYSACHWCHVMEKECFENEQIAQLMNERFISIKVDREERPDLDEIYMNAAQLMTGGGGWPLNVFLTPALLPFHAGTYFPPEDRGGMPGFPKILAVVADYYKNRKDEVLKINAQIQETLLQITSIHSCKEILEQKPLAKAVEVLEGQFDPYHGGFGGAPKFPSSLSLSFLLRYWRMSGAKKALEMVETTLEKMASGGMFDHLGGGFHRYSVDERWLIPHFEKMLYDNALLCRTYVEAFQATGKERYRRVAEDILDYVLREMKSPEGGFYSAEDADSEGEEGKFYVWTRDQVKKVLGKELGIPFCAYYGVGQQGNFEGESSTLNIASSLEKVAGLYGMTVQALEKMLEEGRKTLFKEREKRVRPHRDEKILTSWNALMISGLTDGFRIAGEDRYLGGAKKAARFILEKMVKDGCLMRVFNKGQARVKGYSEDYSFFIQALIDLYEATFDSLWLKRAVELNQEMIRQFWDEDQGGFFFTGKENEALIARSKNPYDNVTPSSNSVAVFNLIRLGSLTGDETLKHRAEQVLQLFYGLLTEQPSGFTHMLSGLSFFSDPEEIGIVGSLKDARTQAMIKQVLSSYLPNGIVSWRDPGQPLDEPGVPFLRDKGAMDVPVTFVCRGFTCLPPVTDEKQLKKVLSKV